MVTLSTVGLFLGFFSLYPAQNLRYLLPTVPLLLVMAAVGVEDFFRKLPGAAQQALLFLGLGVILGCLALVWKPDQKPPLRKAYAEMIRSTTETNAHVLTAWDPVSFYHEIQRGTARRYLPISEKVEYVWSDKVSFIVGGRDSPAIEAIVREGKPVYLDSLGCAQHASDCASLKRHFFFKEVAASEGIRLYRLAVDEKF